MSLRRNFIKILVMALSLAVYDIFVKPTVIASLVESGYAGVQFIFLAAVLGYLTVIMVGIALSKIVLRGE